jgi:hypothetical protein
MRVVHTVPSPPFRTSTSAIARRSGEGNDFTILVSKKGEKTTRAIGAPTSQTNPMKASVYRNALPSHRTTGLSSNLEGENSSIQKLITRLSKDSRLPFCNPPKGGHCSASKAQLKLDPASAESAAKETAIPTPRVQGRYVPAGWRAAPAPPEASEAPSAPTNAGLDQPSRCGVGSPRSATSAVCAVAKLPW